MTRLTIGGTIINASFPRSGHRFLKDHLSLLFGEEFRYFDHYHDVQTSNKNFIKTHDFELAGERVLLNEFPTDRKYLVQVRHPLESIISYYEFKLHWNRIKVDEVFTFKRHLVKQIDKWKRFCDVWCLAPMDNRLIVDYQALYANPRNALETVCTFITGQSFERPHFKEGDVSFRRYFSDDQSQSRQRDIKDFRFYDHEVFKKFEDDLYLDYLKPLGLSPRL